MHTGQLRAAFLIWIGLLALFILLTGCTTVFTNRVACSLDRKEAYFASMYHRFIVGAVIDERDTKVMCQTPRTSE